MNQAQVDLDHTVISTPIDGVVINRAVDVGQTVAASFQAPVLFIIANDLTRMQVNAAVDEADIGRVKAGEDVSFRVDAYPDRSFAGRVEQVRLQPQTIQNVVSYNTIITVDNSEQKLMPGMTATVSIIVRKAENVLRAPAAAARFRPEGFVVEREKGGQAGGGAGSPGNTAVQAADRSGASGGARGGAPPEGRGQGDKSDRGDSRRALVFTLGEGGKPEPSRVRVGLSDGQFVEIKEGLAEGALVITGLEGAAARRPGSPAAGPSPSNNPFAPGPPARRQR